MIKNYKWSRKRTLRTKYFSRVSMYLQLLNLIDCCSYVTQVGTGAKLSKQCQAFDADLLACPHPENLFTSQIFSHNHSNPIYQLHRGQSIQSSRNSTVLNSSLSFAILSKNLHPHLVSSWYILRQLYSRFLMCFFFFMIKPLNLFRKKEPWISSFQQMWHLAFIST